MKTKKLNRKKLNLTWQTKFASIYQNKNCQTWGARALLIFSVLLLLGTTAYGAKHTSNYYSNDADAVVEPYLFAAGPHRHDVVLPNQHTNILKFPLFYIEGHLPYHYASFFIFNCILCLITVGGWAYLLVKLFGKKYAIPILMLLSVLIFSSTMLNVEIGETTIRNIEFPIALWFILNLGQLLSGTRRNRRQLIVSAISYVLYAITVAGDAYFAYVVSAPILLVILWYWIQSRTFSKRMVQVALVVLGTEVGAVALKMLLVKSGFIVTYRPMTTPIVSYDNLWPSISTAFEQFLNLQGAHIFGRQLGVRTLAYFINFIITALGLAGLVRIIKGANRDYRLRKDLGLNDNFVLSVVATCFFMAFIVYVLSNEVVQTLSSGEVVSLGQDRYIALMPFLLLVGIIWFIKNHYANRRGLVVVLVVISLVEILTVIPSVRQDYSSLTPAPTRPVIVSLDNDLKQDNVHEVLTGYWYGSVIRLWSDNTIGFAPIANCNAPFYFNVREAWYVPQGLTRTALVIDRTGPDSPSWACGDATLRQIYGTPKLQQQVVSPNTHEDLSIWVYDYDIRQRLQGFPADK
jgi:hypothetical protein